MVDSDSFIWLTITFNYATYLKGSLFLKNRHFIIQERFKKYHYDHKMWHLTACKISVSLSFLKWIKNEKIFLLYLWISGANINSEIR